MSWELSELEAQVGGVEFDGDHESMKTKMGGWGFCSYDFRWDFFKYLKKLTQNCGSL